MNHGSLLADIVTAEGVAYRGVPLGASTDDLVLREGPDFEESSGSLPHYRYHREVGEMEEYTIYYGLAESRVEEITLHFVTFPGHYWKQKHGELGVDYDAAVEAGALADFSQAFLATRDDVVGHFTKVFGRDPVLERKSPGVFGKKHHQFINHVWADEPMNVRLYVMSYVDDTALHSQLGGSVLYAVRCTMKLHLTRF